MVFNYFQVIINWAKSDLQPEGVWQFAEIDHYIYLKIHQNDIRVFHNKKF
jgi:hypothetical protein